jgi:hypothetical protein
MARLKSQGSGGLGETVVTYLGPFTENCWVVRTRLRAVTAR